jgi:hypothetical protein
MTHVTVTRYGAINTAICVQHGLSTRYAKSTEAQAAAHQHDDQHHRQEPTP